MQFSDTDKKIIVQVAFKGAIELLKPMHEHANITKKTVKSWTKNCYYTMLEILTEQAENDLTVKTMQSAVELEDKELDLLRSDKK